MPRAPRVTAPDLIRALERAGSVRVRVSGSHRVFRHQQKKRGVIVAYHGTRIIPPGTMGNILREAGIESGELEQLLKTR